jgi:hypothetical protein
MYDTETYTRADAAADKASDERDSVIERLKDSDAEFAWKWRIVSSAKVPFKRIKHLEKWCEDYIDEELYAMRDAAEEARDPMRYRGLSWSMFI